MPLNIPASIGEGEASQEGISGADGSSTRTRGQCVCWICTMLNYDLILMNFLTNNLTYNSIILY